LKAAVSSSALPEIKLFGNRAKSIFHVPLILKHQGSAFDLPRLSNIHHIGGATVAIVISNGRNAA